MNWIKRKELVLLESGMQYAFDPQVWAVRDYDAHTFFAGLAGAGLKGIDFLTIFRTRRLVFWEVKHFRYNQGAHSGAPNLPPDALAEQLITKVRDTIRGVGAVGGYYERLWRYRMLRNYLQHFPTQRSDWAFFTRVNQLLLHAERCELLVWLEADPLPENYRRSLYQLLQQELGHRMGHIRIVHSADPPYRASLRVEHLS